MRKRLYSFLTSLFIAASLLVNAQPSPAWAVNSGPAQWMRITSAGALVVGTSEGLKGVDPATGQVSWTLEALANVPAANYEEVSRSPFVSIVPAGDPNGLLIVEPFSGQVVFNSKEAGLSNIASKYFLYENNAIVLVGQKEDKSATMACVDMGSGKVRWTKDDAFSRLTACNSDGPDAIILSTLFFVYKLDANTGAVLWKKSPDPSHEKMGALGALLDKGGANLDLPTIAGVFVTTPYAPGLCFMGMQTEQRKEVTDSQGKKTVQITHKTFLNAFRTEDGAYAWEQPLQMQQKLGAIVPLEQGLLVGAGDRKSVDLLDYNTGTGLWGKNGKGINVKGVLAGAVALEQGTLLTSGGEDGVVTLVDAQGMETWKKPVKLDGVVRSVTKLGGDLLVATEQVVDVIDLSTGLSRLEKPLQGGAGLVANGGGRTWVFNIKDGLLYTLQDQGGAATAVNSVPLVFEGKEKATALEYLDDGLVISSDQNLALMGQDGTVKYRKYLPAPRESGLVRALKYASAVRAAYYSAAYGYTSAAFGAASQSIQVQDASSAVAKEITGAVSDIYGQGAKDAAGAAKRFFEEAGARFKASTSTNDVHYLLSEATKGQYALVALNKGNGSEVGTIPLGSNKEPQYEVDAITNTVYLLSGSEVRCFKP